MKNLAAALCMASLTACGTGPSESSPITSSTPNQAFPDVVTTPLWADVDLESFGSLPEFEDLDFESFVVKPSTDYWELRWVYPRGGTVGVDVIGNSGSKCKTANDLQTCLAAFYDLAATTSDDPREYDLVVCKPGGYRYCYLNVASTAGQEVRAWNSRADLVTFLQGVDHPHEAALLAYVGTFWWKTADKAYGAIKKVNGGYEMIALNGFETCKLERFLLLITTSGIIKRLRSQVAIEYADKSHCPDV